METMKMYVIYDILANEYSLPFCAKNDAVALRMFKNSIIQVEEADKKDYELIYVAYVEGSVVNGVASRLVELQNGE